MSFIFTGTYFYRIDPKGRMRLPTALEKQLGDKLYIGFGMGKYLVVYTHDSVRELSAHRQSLSPTKDMQEYNYYRDVFGSIKDFSCDTQGRYKIPSDYCEMFGLKDEIVIIGNDTVVEIWSKENYEHRRDRRVSFGLVQDEE